MYENETEINQTILRTTKLSMYIINFRQLIYYIVSLR